MGAAVSDSENTSAKQLYRRGHQLWHRMQRIHRRYGAGLKSIIAIRAKAHFNISSIAYCSY